MKNAGDSGFLEKIEGISNNCSSHAELCNLIVETYLPTIWGNRKQKEDVRFLSMRSATTQKPSLKVSVYKSYAYRFLSCQYHLERF